MAPQETSSKRLWLFLFWSLTAVLAVSLGGLAYRTLTPVKVRAASGSPYTVVRTESGFDQAGLLRYTNQYVEAWRTDGSHMKRNTTSLVQQRTVYFANGMNESLGRKSTYPGKNAVVPGRREPDASCLSANDSKVGYVVDGTDSVGGYRTIRLVQRGPKQTITAWHALDAGCALLQLRLEHESGVTVQNLTSFVPGEPGSLLFQVPDTFPEGPPSALFAPICSNGGSCKPLPDEYKQRLDQNYRALRAKLSPQ